jgi:hypothetical protein
MAYRVNGVECDTPEEVLKFLEASRSAKVSGQVRNEYVSQFDHRSAAGILADENKARRAGRCGAAVGNDERCDRPIGHEGVCD